MGPRICSRSGRGRGARGARTEGEGLRGDYGWGLRAEQGERGDGRVVRDFVFIFC